ncbi:DUF3237 domain-containing protein [Leucobacter sp. wl10]|uniref:DUF3237 domain-containing protein n=1 Tax=Leucobacter sp. wl10 TaxID=2304677 RepID=UPI000E5A30B6|nr:DUF3237 domain-containing protein [Leucobacter sp. wl10]RGE20030.1 DUF3237 domain-containing protein [Leucobacter sp. wl10]
MSAAVPGLVPVCEVIVELGEALDFGRTRDGARRFTPILGGELRGIADAQAGEAVRGLRAEILPGGGDRQLVRPDGAVDIDARYDARTAAGSPIGLHATGIRRATADGSYFRVALRFETSDPALAELQDALYVADGVREAGRVRHTVYRAV